MSDHVCCACGKVVDKLHNDCLCDACHELCPHCGKAGYPTYGLAPKKPYPDNFKEDPECPSMGMFCCPVCGDGKNW